jgi:hypothetical protein
VTSKKQVEANRRNANKSTGPKTAAGKARSSRNALKHGILSKIPVLPWVESQKEFDEHMRQVYEDFQPVGRVEEHVTDTIGMDMWLQIRVARRWRELIAAEQEDIHAEASERRRDRRQTAELFALLLTFLKKLPAGVQNIDYEKANIGMRMITASDMIRKMLFLAEKLSPEALLKPELHTILTGTPNARDLAAFLRGLAEECKCDLSKVCKLFSSLINMSRREEWEKATKELRKIETGARRSLLPNEAEMAALCRYNAALDRRLQRNIQFLERRQATRRRKSMDGQEAFRAKAGK